MLTIRAAQMAAFRESRVGDFVDGMTHYLATEYPRHWDRLGEVGMRSFVERSVATAAGMGIRLEGAVGALIELWLVYGERFERSPEREWVRNILAHPRLPDHVKVEAIQDRLDARTGGRVLVEHPVTT